MDKCAFSLILINMKIFFILFSLFLGAPAAFSAPWGSLSDIDTPREENDKTAFRPGDNYLLSSILKGNPVRLYLVLTEQDEKNRASYERLLTQAYQEWFSKPAEIIRRAGRAEEFADVLPLLDRGVRVVFSDSSEEKDVTVYINSLKNVMSVCGRGAVGCYRFEQKDLWISKDHFIFKAITLGKMSAKVTGVHEIGHSLGLSDQYQEARSDNSHAIYSSSEPGDGVMNRGRSVSCDDADGIINLIDIVRGTTRGGDLGWRSLCKKSKDVYSAGRPLSRGPYVIDENDGWELRVYENGRAAQRYALQWHPQARLTPFQAFAERPVERDGSGRVVRAAGPNGEDVYYSYVYDRKSRLVLKEGKILLVDVAWPSWSQNKWKRVKNDIRLVQFQLNGKLASLWVAHTAKTGGLTLEGYQNGSLGVSILSFDKSGRVIEESSSFLSAQQSAAQKVTGLSSYLEQETTEASQKGLRQMLVNWYRRQYIRR